MSPLQVKLLLHIYAIPEPIENPDGEITKDTIKEWMENGIIEPYGAIPYVFRTTKRGDAWVKMICATPVPIQAWIDPRTKESK